jgi:HAD superfamily hydrolase (TIGR01509 family)
VGFDLDFTLWDQEAFVDSFLADAAEDLGGRIGCGGPRVARAFRECRALLPPGHPRLFDACLRRLGVEDRLLVGELVERYHRHRPPMTLYPGARETLEALGGRGLGLFLVTDGHADTQRYKVEALGLGETFALAVFTEDFPRALRKPSPFPFLLACRRLGIPPARCAYVGDNPGLDVAGPRRLGMLTVGVPTGPYAAGPGPAPDLRISALGDLGVLL